jgi:hypothetical protein
MYPISNNTAHLTGASEVDRVSPFQDEARTPRSETERDGGAQSGFLLMKCVLVKMLAARLP